MEDLPQELQDSLDKGELTRGQLKELIAHEAAAINLTFEEALQRYQTKSLPDNLIGHDLEMLIYILEL